MPVLMPLHRTAGLEAIVVSTYQAVSGGGLNGGRRARRAGAQGGRPGRGAHLPGRRGRVPRAAGLRRADRVQRHPAPVHDRRRRPRRDRRGAEAPPGVPQDPRHPRARGVGRCACGCRCSPATRSRSTPASRDPITPDEARTVLSGSPGVEVVDLPTPQMAAGNDPTYVGASGPTRPSRAAEAWRCSAPATTSARARRSTRSRSPSSWPRPAEAVALLHGARRRALRPAALLGRRP